MLKVNKVVGLDKILVRLVRDVEVEFVFLLIYFINKLIIDGIVFVLWKVVCVIFLYKFEDKFLVENYRFIFVLFVLSKVLERVVYI